MFAPSRADDAAWCEAIARYERLSASPKRHPPRADRQRPDRRARGPAADPPPDADRPPARGPHGRLRQRTLPRRSRARRGLPRAAGRRPRGVRGRLRRDRRRGRALRCRRVDARAGGARRSLAVDGALRRRRRLDRSSPRASATGPGSRCRSVSRDSRASTSRGCGRVVDTAGDGPVRDLSTGRRARSAADTVARALQSEGLALRAWPHTGEKSSRPPTARSAAWPNIGARVMASAGAGGSG